MIARVFKILLIVLLISGCGIGKEARYIKKRSKIIRESKILISGKYSGEMVVYTLNLRENNFFDIVGYVLISNEYYAGTWCRENGKIRLNYINGHKSRAFQDYLIIDNHKNALVMEKEDSSNLNFFIDSLYGSIPNKLIEEK